MDPRIQKVTSSLFSPNLFISLLSLGCDLVVDIRGRNITIRAPGDADERNGDSHNEDYDDENDDEGWDYLEDGYYTLDERAELRDIVRREKQEMRDDADSSKLGKIQQIFHVQDLS